MTVKELFQAFEPVIGEKTEGKSVETIEETENSKDTEEQHWNVPPKIIPVICTSRFAVYFVRIRLSQLAKTPSSGQNFPQIVTHILQKAVFRHALENKI